MNRRRTGRLALVTALLLATAGAMTPSRATTVPLSDHHVQRPPVSPVVARALGPAGELRGMSLNDVGASNKALQLVALDFPTMAKLGVTSVALYVYLYLPNPEGNEVSTGTYTPSDADIATVGQAAASAGLGLQVMPVLLDTASNSWRGRYRPSDPAAFFASYTAALVHYADLADQAGASLFYVGSENDAIAHWKQWIPLVAEVRQHFHGALSYMATPATPLSVSFWKQLDIAAISPYFSLGEDAAPSYNRMRAAWATVHTPFVRALAKKIGKPMIYAEAGYRSQMHGFAHPADPAAVEPPAPAAQADAYAALLDVLAQEPSVYGVNWWHWSTDSLPLDKDFAPNNKPAECVLATHWSRDADVQSAATLPTCDLHALDTALTPVGNLLPTS